MIFSAFIPLLVLGQEVHKFVDDANLFSPTTDGVVTLHEGNIKEFLNYSSLPVLVLFYASWCGHCIVFSREYKELQKETENWDVYVAAINCANYRNNKVCDDYYMVDSYPTIILFNCLEDEKNKNGTNIEKTVTHHTIHDIRALIAKLLLQQTRCMPLVHRTTDFSLHFWTAFKDGRTTYDVIILVIGESSHNDIINGISLDLRVCNNIMTAFLDINRKDLVSHFGSFSAPTVVYVDRSLKIANITSSLDDFALLRTKMFEVVKDVCPEISSLTQLLYTPKGSPKFNDTELREFNEIHMEDIISGVAMSLRQEIPRAPITKEMVPIIKKYVDVITECVYWPKPNKEFLYNLKQWIASQGEEIKNKDWSSFMNSDQAFSVFPLEATWISCKGYNAFYRGFPCSVWLTFHIATVKCEKPGLKSHLNSLDVLVAMRGYIINFFGCHVCREHFKELTRHVQDQVKTEEDGILFLWNGHNTVNARLRYDDSADPTAPKIQFPSERMCPDCRMVDGLAPSEFFNSTPGYDVPATYWNRRSVLDFLRNHYGPNNILLPHQHTPIKNLDLYDTSSEFVQSLDTGRRRKSIEVYSL